MNSLVAGLSPEEAYLLGWRDGAASEGKTNERHFVCITPAGKQIIDATQNVTQAFREAISSRVISFTVVGDKPPSGSLRSAAHNAALSMGRKISVSIKERNVSLDYYG